MIGARAAARTWAGWLVLAGTLVATLGAAEAGGRWFTARCAARVVDIQHPGQLLPKLRMLRSFEGFKVVVLGDSLIHGRTMRDHGDARWREHTLPACLERRLRAAPPAASPRDLLVLNLGIDGAVPGDYEPLIRLVTACDVDLVILDIHLRLFSRDFAAPEVRLARPWLAGIDPAHLERSARLLEWRGLLQANAREAVIESGRTLRHLLGLAGRGTLEGADPDLLLLRLARRYESVDLDEVNPQVAALRRGLEHLRQHGQETILFYARENPDLRPVLFPEGRYDRLRADLDRLIESCAGPALHIIPGSPRLEPRHYLDALHLNAGGFEILAEDLPTHLNTRP